MVEGPSGWYSEPETRTLVGWNYPPDASPDKVKALVAAVRELREVVGECVPYVASARDHYAFEGLPRRLADNIEARARQVLGTQVGEGDA